MYLYNLIEERLRLELRVDTSVTKFDAIDMSIRCNIGVEINNRICILSLLLLANLFLLMTF